MKKILFIFQLALISFICQAQSRNNTDSAIAIEARSYADHIVLRYFATTPALFNRAIKEGYVIERAEFKEGIPFEKQTYVPVKGSPFKRWNDEQWQKTFKESDKKDSNTTKLAGFAMLLSDSNVKASNGNVLDGGLKSLKEERDNQDMRFAFALIAANRSKMAAEGLAIRVTDNDVVEGTTYVYRVHINGSKNSNKIEIAYVKVKCERFDEKYLLNNKAVKIVEGDSKISFSFPESKEYYAFNVERSDDGGISYIKLTTEPTLKLKPHGYKDKTEYGYGDSGLINYKKYYYRIMVSTPFADDLLLSEFMAMPRDKTPPPVPFLKSAKHIKPNQVELIWEFPDTDKNDLKGFKVKRSNEVNGNYILISKNILSTNSRNYIDEEFDKEGANYYMLEAIDTAGNISQSLPSYVTLIDSTPPAIPVISSATIDSLGRIIIRIKPNIEKDFMGYEVLKANSKEHEFTVIQQTFKDSLGHTTFIIFDSTTLNTLTKNIYYEIVSVDYNFNQSEPSKIIELKKRDTIPPVSPIITDFSVNDSSIVLTFVNSGSEDVASNYLLRKESGKEKYDTIFINTNYGITEFIDKKIIGGKQYEYTMLAKDDGGLISKNSRSILIKTLLNNRIPTPILKGFYDDNSKKVLLSFEIDERVKGRIIKIEINRRANEKSSWTDLKIIDFEKGKTFIDDQIKGQKGMLYIIRLLDENNNASNYSKELELKF